MSSGPSDMERDLQNGNYIPTTRNLEDLWRLVKEVSRLSKLPPKKDLISAIDNCLSLHQLKLYDGRIQELSRQWCFYITNRRFDFEELK